MKALISGGRNGSVNEGGMHVKHELRQESQFCTEPERNVGHDQSLRKPINEQPINGADGV